MQRVYAEPHSLFLRERNEGFLNEKSETQKKARNADFQGLTHGRQFQMALGQDFFGLFLAEQVINFTVLGRLHAED